MPRALRRPQRREGYQLDIQDIINEETAMHNPVPDSPAMPAPVDPDKENRKTFDDLQTGFQELADYIHDSTTAGREKGSQPGIPNFPEGRTEDVNPDLVNYVGICLTRIAEYVRQVNG